MTGMTLVAYYKSVNTGGVLSVITPVNDQHVSFGSNFITVPDWAKNLVGIAVLALHNGSAQIQAPSLRAATYEDVSPLIGALSFNDPDQFFDLTNDQKPLQPAEGLQLYMAGSEGGAEGKYGLIWLADTLAAQPDGIVETIKFTGTTTLTANTWTQVPLVAGQQLRAGVYTIVGMRAISASGIAARMIIPGVQYRPGVPCVLSEATVDFPKFRRGNFGAWGTFPHTAVLSAEFLASAGDTAETVYLDVVKSG